MDTFEYARRTWWLVAAAVAITLIAVLVTVNLISAEKKIAHRVTRLYTIDDPRFRYKRGLLLGPPFLDGNRYQVLRNGDEIFPALLDAIKAVQASISFETYIYWSGDTGREFSWQMSLAARRGVKVHLLLDWLGAVKMNQALPPGNVASYAMKKWTPE
jgi:cardiolipin synthase